MDYKGQIEKLKYLEAIAYGYKINGEVLGMDCSNFEQIMVDSADAITALLFRAEEAEARCKNMYKIVKEYHEELIPGYRDRAEKAEKCISTIEGDLDRGNDNDWAREHIAEWRKKEG